MFTELFSLEHGHFQLFFAFKLFLNFEYNGKKLSRIFFVQNNPEKLKKVYPSQKIDFCKTTFIQFSENGSV